MSNFASFYKKISYQFRDEKLLLEALTHPSFSQEDKHAANYQRLEFLGDKVLSLVIGEFLMEKYPHEMEGALSRRQAAFVSGETLAEIALQLGIDELMRLSMGEKKLGGKSNKRNLENALEALIGALYLDSNYESAKKFILTFWQDLLQKDIAPPKDPVSELQELAQAKSRDLPKYETEQAGGSDHAPEFISRVILPFDNLEFSASGKSKKEAQKEAAKVALEYFKQH